MSPRTDGTSKLRRVCRFALSALMLAGALAGSALALDVYTWLAQRKRPATPLVESGRRPLG